MTEGVTDATDAPDPHDALDALAALPHGRRVTPDQRDTIRRFAAHAYSAGASIRTIAARAHRSYAFIHALLTEARVPLRGRGGDVRSAAARGRD